MRHQHAAPTDEPGQSQRQPLQIEPRPRRGRHLRGAAGRLAAWRRPATLLWAAMTAACAVAVTLTLMATAADPTAKRRAPQGSAAAAPTTADPAPTGTVRAAQGSPPVNRIEAFSGYPDGLQVQVEEAEWWHAPGSTHLDLVKALVRVRNGSRRPVDARRATVTLRYGRARAVAELVEPGHFSAPVPAGADRFAQWLWTLPAGNHDNLEVEVTVGADRRPLVFRGAADLP